MSTNRLVGDGVPLDRVDVDRAVQLRRLVPAASVVDALVAVAAARVAADAVIEVLTSDVASIAALTALVWVRRDVVTPRTTTSTGMGVFGT